MDPRVYAVRFAPASPEDDESGEVRGKSQTLTIGKKHLSRRHPRAKQERSELRRPEDPCRNVTAMRPNDPSQA
jgi:hypothetical protein